MVAGGPVAAQPLESWLRPFAAVVGEAAWRRALILVAGALLAPGRRTVASALRAAGLGSAPGFAGYHRVLSHARCGGLALAERLLALLVAAFAPEGPVVLALDDTLERRWGRRIRARGIYRDPVRSSRGHFVKASGLRWLSLMLVVPIPWARRPWALPFLTVLAPSERYARGRGRRRHKRLTDWARQALLQAARWLPGRRVVVVADGGFAALELLAAVRRHLAVVTRLRLDARLFAPPPPRTPRTIGRPRLVGERLPTLARPAGGVPAPALPLPRPGRRPRRHPVVVRPALGHRGDLRGGAPPPRRGDPAAMVGPGHRAHHAGAAGAPLPRGAVGRRAAPRLRHPSACRDVVRQAHRDIQRCSGHGAPGDLDRSGFARVHIRRRGGESAARGARPPDGPRLLRGLTRQSRAQVHAPTP